MCNFIKILGEAIGYYSMNASTEVRVFTDDEFRVVVPACCNEGVEGGYSMTAQELEDYLSQFKSDDLGGYERKVEYGEMEVVDDGTVVLYGVPVSAVH